MSETPIYLVAHVGFSQDRSFMAMADIASAHWKEEDAVEKATYEQLGEFTFEGRPFKRENVVYRVTVDRPGNRVIKELWVTWSTAKALDSTGRFASRVTGVFIDEAPAQEHMKTLDGGDIDIKGFPFRVANHISRVTVQ